MDVAIDPTLLRNLAIALFIGALVGVDRERRATEGLAFGGLRTFMLVALFGAASVWLGGVLGATWLVGVALLGLVALLSLAYWMSAPAEGDLGITSELAAVIVFLLGAACVAGQPEMAVVGAITTSALLAFKAPLHALVGKIGEDDLAAALKLLFATFIVLPVLPREAVDPWGVLVPYRLWWLVVLISGLSLLGYVAVRLLGERRGLLLTGLFGGLASSTAVTLSTARQSGAGGPPSALAMSALVAWAVMFVRVLVEVTVTNRALLAPLAVPLGAMAAACAIGAAVLGRLDRGEPEALDLRNPFSLTAAARFAALFAGVLLAVELGRRFLPDTALYGIAALAGTTDVDAITLSMASLAGGDLAPEVAVRAIAVAAASNTLVKLGLVAALGTRAMAVRVGAVTAVVLLAGLVGALVAG
ncbi:MAG: DUF4010 domain-containing protein [Myxococcota bacterium]